MKRVAAIALVLVVSLFWATPAFAHAGLESSDPVAAALLATSPSAVTLKFTEAVGIPDGAIRLFDGSGTLIAIGSAVHAPGSSATITATLPMLKNGVYVVAWRAVSADSHPVSGAYTFTVGPATGVDPGSVVNGILKGARADRGVSITTGIARFLFFACFAALIGALAFPFITGADRDDRWWRLVARTAESSVIAGLLTFVLTAPASAGKGFGAIGQSSAWRALMQTNAGKAGVIRLGVLFIAALVAASTQGARRASRLGDWFVCAWVGVAVIASAFAGHGGSGRWIVVGLVVTMAHTLAMGAWFGGLGTLAVVTVGRPRSARQGVEVEVEVEVEAEAEVEVEAGVEVEDVEGDDEAVNAPHESLHRVVERFSNGAFVAVVVLTLTGVVQGWRQLGLDNSLTSLSTYTSTSFGRLLLIKVAVVVVMVGIAASSRRVVRRREGLGLRSRVIAEVAVGLAVLAVTSALIVTNPSAATQSAGSVTVDAGDAAVVVSVFVEPARVGSNQLHISVRSPDFGPDVYDDVTLKASLASRDLGPIDIALVANGQNHFTAAAAQFPYPGTWTFTVAVRVSEFDRRVFTLKVHIRP